MACKVPFVDLPAHFKNLEKELAPIVNDVLFARADFILRDDLSEFEKNIASFLGAKYAVGVNSGTDALILSLLAAGIGTGDEVITVAHTFVATIASIVHCGATPVLVDVGDDYNMDVSALEKAITARTKAIIPVHLNGRLCNMEKIMTIAKNHKLIVIEDAAQAVGAAFNGQKAGTFGLTGCFSLYPMKVLGGIGDGGLVTTNDEGFAKKLRSLRDHGQNRPGRDILFYGYNSRLDNVNAAVLNLKLKHLPKWLERRREIAEKYKHGLLSISSLSLPNFNDPKYFDIFQNYVIRLKERDALIAYLDEKGVETLISWPQPVYKYSSLKLEHYHLPKTEQLCKEVISLPMNTELTDEQVEYVIKCVKEFCLSPVIKKN